MSRLRTRSAVCLLASVCAWGGLLPDARAGGTLRIGMTAADIPLTTGIPDQGGEGYRFIGYQLYDALVNWNLSRSDVLATLTPGLATEWHPDPTDPTKWIFTLRRGVKFHDGSPFNADAVIWNFDKVLKRDAPQYDPRQVAQVLNRIPSFAGYRKLDDDTVEITTKFPNAIFPFEATSPLFSSPAQWEAVGRDWLAFASNAVIDGLVDQVLTTFDEEKRDDLLRQIHARLVDQAYLVFICHDLNPCALSPKVAGFVQAQSWSQDLTPIEMK